MGGRERGTLRCVVLLVALGVSLGCYESRPPALDDSARGDTPRDVRGEDGGTEVGPANDAGPFVEPGLDAGQPDRDPGQDAGPFVEPGLDAGLPDRDLDHYPRGIDCDDQNPAVHPDAQETCNDVDDDCDGEVDEEAVDGAPAYADDDRDTWGDCDRPTVVCAPLDGTVLRCSDCDDADPATHPGASEWCDGLDNDCDGMPEQEGQECSAVSSMVGDAAPGPSCSGEYARAGTIRVVGCPTVAITGIFTTECGNDGQVSSASADDTSFTLTWDDAPVGVGSDCDLDLECRTSWVAGADGEALTITVTHEALADEAGCVNRCGYSITDHEDVWLGPGDAPDTQTYVFPCRP